MKKMIVLVVVLYTTTQICAQGVGIGTSAPHTSAQLEVSSTSKGLLTPRLTLAQRNLITAPATGLLIYQTDNTAGFYYYNGLSWQPMVNGGGMGAAYLIQNNAPSGPDTSKIWVNNSPANNGVWPMQTYFRGKWNIDKYYDSVANYVSQYKPLVVIATGQSNMIDRPDPGRTNTPDSRILLWNGSAWVTWTLAPNINHLGFQFSKNVAAMQDRVVRVIVSAVNGESIDAWYAPSGARYTEIRTMITASKTKAVDVILWRQGEAQNNDFPAEYKVKLDTVINRFRNETFFNKINPIIVGGLGSSFTKGGPAKYFETINELDDPSLLYQSNTGIYSGDFTHLNGPAVDSSGRRMAAVFLYGKQKSQNSVSESFSTGGSIYSRNSEYTGGDNHNIVLGLNSGSHASISGQNVAVGNMALRGNVANSVALGFQAAGGTGNISEGVGVGAFALSGVSEQAVTAVGYYSGGNLGYASTAIGWKAGFGASGGSNTIIGGNAGYTSGGSANTFVGYLSGYNSRAGSNTAFGYNSLRQATGSFNTAIGDEALSNSTTSGNTALGYHAGMNNTFTNIIAIGNGAVAGKNNQVVLGTVTQTELKVNNYRFNIAQPLPATEGYVLGYNASSGQLELILSSIKANIALDFLPIISKGNILSDVSVPGAVPGDIVVVEQDASQSQITYNGWVTAPNTVRIKAYNISLLQIDPAPKTFKVVVYK
ncbi:MAG: sialate O-acetylesterase [Bacteroidota bacterium]